MKFINVDIDYVKALHDMCEEVRYNSIGYDNKLYVGILINNNERKYVIQLSSAKKKHRYWKDINKEMYLIYENVSKSDMSNNDIWVETDKGKVKHIMSVLDIKKMIPIKDGYYSVVQLNPKAEDSEKISKYKALLNKEYSFCLKIIDEVIEKANKIYDKQIRTGNIAKFCCDFKKLERVCDTYN
jgi:protein AbiQ